MSEWKEYKLSEITTKIGSGATPRGGQESYKNEGISLIRSQNILDFEFSRSGLAFIDDVQASQLSNVEVLEEDILLNITGDSVARVCKVPRSILPARVNQHVSIIRAKKSKVTPNYILYYLLNPLFKKFMLMIASDGATRNALTKGEIEDFDIRLPPKEIQSYIASVLSNLDSKIDLLRRQNQTLENIAQTLFKRWFVDFEFPDKVGKPYKSSGGKMVESEFGEIPEGWRIGAFEEIMEFTNGYAFKSKEILNIAHKNSYAIFKMGDIKKGGGFNDSKTKSYIEKEKCEDILKYVLKKGDILMCMTDMKDSTSLLGHTALMFEDNHFIVNQRVGLIRAKNNINIDYPWIYILTNSINFIADLRNRANSGVQINLSTNEIKNSRVIIPDKRINKLFDDLTKPMFEKIMNNTFQVKALTKTRDTLLPKLMSGQMRVKDL